MVESRAGLLFLWGWGGAGFVWKGLVFLRRGAGLNTKKREDVLLFLFYFIFNP